MRFAFRGRNFAVALACLGLAGCAAGAQTPPTPASAVTLTISFPADVTIMPLNAIVQTPPQMAQLALANTSSSPLALRSPNDCQAHVWTVTDANGNTIDDRNICPMIFMQVTLRLAAHGTFTTSQTVPLAYDKYRDGGHYTLHYTFWGLKADAPFTVHVVQ
jgi:hypothetical protein